MVARLPFLISLLACVLPFSIQGVAAQNIKTDVSALMHKQELRIAFGSCNANPDSPIWESIISKKPDIMLFLGDNIYQTQENFGDEAKISSFYSLVFSYPSLKTLVETVSTFAIWDDHDFGPNNSDSTSPYKTASYAAFHKFWKNPPAPPGLEGSVAFKVDLGNVLILMMDERSYRVDRGGSDSLTMFGKAQLDWVEKEIDKFAGKLVVFASGTQILSTTGKQEAHFRYPNEHERLYQIFRASKKPIIILSGDRHFAEILEESLGTKSVLEVTSSPLTARLATSSYVEVDRVQRAVENKSHNFGVLSVKTSDATLTYWADVYDKHGKRILSTKWPPRYNPSRPLKTSLLQGLCTLLGDCQSEQ